MKWILYNLLFSIAYVAMLPRFVLRMRKRGGYRRGFAERFGIYRPDVLAPVAGTSPVWIHAVSVGEVAVAARFMTALRAANPDLHIVLSVTTSTGQAVARRHLTANDALIYFPIDFPAVARRVCRILNPRLLLLTEGEIWPNLIRRLDQCRVPVAVINGRMSERSFAGYRCLRWFFAETARRIALFLVQTEADRERLLALGAVPERVQVTGSVKYDLGTSGSDAADHARDLLRQAGIAESAVLLVGGSTWPGEETALAAAYRAARPQHPDLRLVLVPRHAERRAEIRAELDAAGLRTVMRSELDSRDGPPPDTEVLVVDSTGELAGFYAVADLVFVGKSLGQNHGGQNLIEPAGLGKAIITGPNMENFPGVIQDFRTAGAVRSVPDEAALTRTVGELLRDTPRRAELAQRAGELVARRRGALDRSLARLAPLL